MKSVLALSLTAAAAFQGASALVRKECTNPEKSFLIVRDGLDNAKELARAADKKLAFVVETADLSKAQPVAKKYGKEAVVWELSKRDLKAARKYRKKSKKLSKAVKNLMKLYKKETGKKLKLVILPSGTSERIVKRFEKKHVTVIKAGRKLKKASNTKKFIKKARKASKKQEKPSGSIVSFKFGGKNNAKLLKKLRKALKIANAEKCFKAVKKTSKSEATDSQADESQTLESTKVPQSSSCTYSIEGPVIFDSSESSDSSNSEAEDVPIIYNTKVATLNEPENIQSSAILNQSQGTAAVDTVQEQSVQQTEQAVQHDQDQNDQQAEQPAVINAGQQVQEQNDQQPEQQPAQQPEQPEQQTVQQPEQQTVQQPEQPEQQTVQQPEQPEQQTVQQPEQQPAEQTEQTVQQPEQTEDIVDA
jgi:hypothetical protein